jgi:3-phosphoshikimate 1-carboxyvinyltransferase
MKIKVKKSTVCGTISVPSSKSHTIRALAIATAAEGRSLIYNPLISEDTLAGLNAAQMLGAKIAKTEGLWKIDGTGGKFKKKANLIDMQNSGTSLRIFSGIASTADFPITFDGDSSLRSRPMSPLISALEKLGVNISSTDGRCPLTISGPLKGGKTIVEGTSSQFLTSLLIALPLANDDSYVKVVGLNEVPYIEMTLDWLCREGIEIEYPEDMSYFKIKGNQTYPSFDVTIPADFSTAAFPLAAAVLTQGKITIRDLDFNDHQGDKALFEFMKEMGADIVKKRGLTKISAPTPLKGKTFDLNATPDALPVMAVTGALTEGKTSLVNCPQARIKETDRIKCMSCELRKMGADIEELEDGMIINSSTLHHAEVQSYGDHRIAMALTIAGMCTDGETIIDEAEAAAVTYPSFVKDFQGLGADITIVE